MRDWLTSILELAGAACIVAGVALWSVPGALIVGGILAVVAGVAGADR